LARSQRRLCAASCASSYVTHQALQRRYPPRPGALALGCSDVELPQSVFAERPRTAPAKLPRPSLITVGSLNHLYKAPDILVEAVALCRRNGLDAGLVIIGDGTCRAALGARCRSLGIHDQVVFRGHLAFGDAVRRELDRADLFVLPSRQEGLPRALLEAMARGLPAIGSTVGGIPELLPREDLVPPNDSAALARKIEEICSNPARLERMSARNLATSREYEETRLGRHRDTFLAHLRAETEHWSHGRQRVNAAAGNSA
jgi:glycosyltransferase involved in cell wall biosynthesis